MKRLLISGVAAAIVAFGGASTAFAGEFAGDGDNFGQCAKGAAHFLPDPSGGAQGEWMKLAQSNNPHDRDLECDQTGYPVFP